MVSDKQIERFVSSVKVGCDFWQQAGRELVKLRQEDERVFERIVELEPWLTLDMLESLHEIGLGKLDPYTLLLPPKLSRRVAEMSLEDQHVFNEGYREKGIAYSGVAALYTKAPVTELGTFEARLVNGKVFLYAAKGPTNRKPQTVKLSPSTALIRFVA